MELIYSPFTPFQVQALNEHQINASQASALAGHPFTCANRSDGNHGLNGPDCEGSTFLFWLLIASYALSWQAVFDP